MFKKIIFEGFWTTFHKKQHLGAKLGMTGTFAIVAKLFLKISCARKPILCSVSQTCFDWQARCFVTFQLLTLSFPNEKKNQKRGILAPRVETATFRIPPAISKRSFYVSVRHYKVLKGFQGHNFNPQWFHAQI